MKKRSLTVKYNNETKLNKVLHTKLEKKGLKCIWESEHHPNIRIDIEVFFENLNIHIAIELEKNGTNKHAEAVKDAASRLFPHKLVEVSVAVVYPPNCNNESDITANTKLEYAIITEQNINKYGDDHKTHANSIRWHTCTVNNFSEIIKAIPSNLGNPDILAANLKTRLINSTTRMNNTLIDKLSELMSLPTEPISATRALLVISAACLFHARLDSQFEKIAKDKKLMSLNECLSPNNDIISSLGSAWSTILEIDYRPIFETAVKVLEAGSDPSFVTIIRNMAEWGRIAARSVEGIRHDLLGRIFHEVLSTAKHDGSFYTTTPAAVLLAGLAIRSKSDIPKAIQDMRIIDPACGTGTLLMAASKRIETLKQNIDHSILIENIIYGIDVNTTAAHMAATTLGLLSPSTKFKKMNIGVTILGKDPVDQRIRAGSLELYEDGGLLSYLNWTTGPIKHIDTNDFQEVKKHFADLVIMNPPYTRNSLRHDQFEPNIENKIKEREEVIFKNIKNVKHSSGPMFVMLGERLLKNGSSNPRPTMALVLPSVVMSSVGNKDLRIFLTNNFHIDTILLSVDPNRIYFSENTTIQEMLLILRRKNNIDDENINDTRIITVKKNPSTVTEAESMVSAINNNYNSNAFTISTCSYDLIKNGIWQGIGIQFESDYLYKQFVNIKNNFIQTISEKYSKNMVSMNRKINLVPLNEIATIKNPRRVRGGIFKEMNGPGSYNWHARYYHETDEVKTLCSTPDRYIAPNIDENHFKNQQNKLKILIKKDSKKKIIKDEIKKLQNEIDETQKIIDKCQEIWNSGAQLHIVERVRPALVKTMAIITDEPSIGSAWYQIIPNPSNEWPDNELYIEKWSKAMVVYLNSTIGLISLLGERTAKTLMYIRYSVGNIGKICVPQFNESEILTLSSIYEKYKNKNIDNIKNYSATRIKLDDAISKILHISPKSMKTMRSELAKEQIIQGKRKKTKNK